MKKRIKKQRRKILLSVISVMIVAWLVVSAAFSFVVLRMEYDAQINDECYRNSEYFDIVNGGFTNNLFTSTEMMKENILVISEFESDDVSGEYDKDFQAVIFEKPTGKMMFNTADSIAVSFYGLVGEYDMEFLGFLSYERFINSLTDEQLKLVKSYITQPPDEKGNRYCIIATEFYGNPETSEIIPTKIDIAYRNELNRWHSTSSIYESLTLNPEGCEGLDLYRMDYDCANYVPTGFVLGDFSSGNILPDAEEPIVFKNTMDYFNVFDNPKVEKETLFTYIYHNNLHVYTTSDPLPEGVELIDGEEEPQEYVFYVKYIARLNLLEGCKEFLSFGLIGIFIFFALIAVGLCFMLLKMMKSQLAEEQRRREVTNALAHDIKTPLFIIQGYAQSLQENINTEKHPHYVERIIERTKEVNALVHKMLDFSRLDSSTYNPVIAELNLTELMNKVADDFDKLEDNKSLKLQVKENVMVNADRSLVERALTNLLENAVKYSEPQTVIAVELTDNSVCFTNVTKNLTQSDLKRLTEPYFRMDKNRNTKGNGLGLSVVKSVCEIHNFKLDISLENDIIKFLITF